MTEDRFCELLEAYSDRSISEDQSRELLEAFEADPPLKAQFLRELSLQNSLLGLPLLKKEEVRVDEVIRSILPRESRRDLSATVLSELQPAISRKAWIAPLKLAAGIVATAAIGWLVFSNSPQAGVPLATVAHQIDASWRGDGQVESGSGLGKGRLRLASGVIRLDFAKGVRVTLEGPADFELIGPGETRLHSGNLTAHVPPEGIGFQVHTERAKVVDLGTTFGVTVGTDGATDVAVYEGEVEVTSLATREEKIIREGDIVTLDENSGSLTPAKLKTRSFRGWPVLFGVLNTGGHIRFVNAQPFQNPADVIDEDHVVVFPERFGTRLKSDLPVTITEPGDYSPEELRAGKATVRADKRRLNTYLIQYNPPHIAGALDADQRHFIGDITFDHPIVGIIADRDQLLATDLILGKKRFKFPAVNRRGLEHDDFLSLSPDRRTLKIDWLVRQSLKNGMDQIRVIVDASDQQPVR